MSGPSWRRGNEARCQAGPGLLGKLLQKGWYYFLSSIDVVCACSKWEINPSRLSLGLFWAGCWNLHKSFMDTVHTGKQRLPPMTDVEVTWELLLFICVQSRASSLCRKGWGVFWIKSDSANLFSGLIHGESRACIIGEGGFISLLTPATAGQLCGDTPWVNC